MGKITGIEWTRGPDDRPGATWNPWRGCRRISPGCAACYCFREMQKYDQNPNMVVRSKTTFHDPLKWTEPTRIFACSWSDWFIEEADPWRSEAYDIMQRARHHTYLLLTKRPERAAGRLPWGDNDTPWPNVWLGVSVENTKYLWRIEELLKLPAATYFVSVEPLLGPVDLREYFKKGPCCRTDSCIALDECSCLTRVGINWVIAGGESGGPPERALVERCPGWRPDYDQRGSVVGCPMSHYGGYHPKEETLEWVRSIRDQCVAAGVPFFFKQWGGATPKSGGRLLDGRECNEFPT